MISIRGDRPVLRIGHRGAAAIAPENTLRGFEAALETGVDWIEFDVLDLEDETLVLAHSNDLHEVSHGAHAGLVRTLTLDVLRRFAPEMPTLDEALEFFAARPHVGLHLDLKTLAHGQEIADALARHGVAERTLVSSHSWEALREIAAPGPAITRGLTYPEDRYGIATRPVLRPVLGAAVIAMRSALPRRIEGWLARAGASVAVLHQAVVSRAVVERCHAHGAPVIAWTVDDPLRARRLAALGVDGIVSNDPRIFASL